MAAGRASAKCDKIKKCCYLKLSNITSIYRNHPICANADICSFNLCIWCILILRFLWATSVFVLELGLYVCLLSLLSKRPLFEWHLPRPFVFARQPDPLEMRASSNAASISFAPLVIFRDRNVWSLTQNKPRDSLPRYDESQTHVMDVAPIIDTGGPREFNRVSWLAKPCRYKKHQGRLF